MRLHCIGLVALVATTTLGCKKDEATDEDYDDVATAVGALIAPSSGEGGEVGSMEDAEALAMGEDAGLTSMGGGDYEGTVAGLKYSYSVTCQDTSGATLDPCDATTDSANLVVAWSGELNLNNFQASVDRTGDWTLSGLQSDTAEFNGTGTFDVDTAFQALFRDVERTFTLDYDAEYQGVTWRRSDKLLLDGEIDYTVHAVRTRTDNRTEREVELDVLVNVQFDGSGVATITLDGERNYSLDVATGKLSKE
jgi:hypothetical protein